MHLLAGLLAAISMIPGLYHDQNGRSLYAALDVEDVLVGAPARCACFSMR